jgi:hypothetical protein
MAEVSSVALFTGHIEHIWRSTEPSASSFTRKTTAADRGLPCTAKTRDDIRDLGSLAHYPILAQTASMLICTQDPHRDSGGHLGNRTFEWLLSIDASAGFSRPGIMRPVLADVLEEARTARSLPVCRNAPHHPRCPRSRSCAQGKIRLLLPAIREGSAKHERRSRLQPPELI